MGRMAEPTPASASTASRKRLRRIPDEFRKRTAQSCDLCRKRRCRCVPAADGQGCVACQSQQVSCSYNLPRKTRFYGSVDDLSDRYKCLEAIVKGAFPDEPISTTEELLQLGERHGISMPDLAHDQPAQLKALMRDDMSTLGPIGEGEGDGRQHADGDAAENMADEDETSSPSEPLGLIRDTSGREHYIGASGSLQFWGQLRQLLISYEQGQSGETTGHPSKLREDDAAQALEADAGHDEDDTADVVAPMHPVINQVNHESPGSISSSIAKDFTRQSYEEAEDFLAQLPSQQTLEPLIESFFKNVHEDFPLFHRGTFQEELESYLARARQRAHRPRSASALHADSGWLGCLQMMIVLGSMSNPHIPGVDHIALRKQCVTATRNLLPWFVSKCSLSNVRALLLLSLFLHNNNERSAAWNLVGTATRISFALGLHRKDTGSQYRLMEREVRKRVFCTLYGFEQFLSSLLGRPLGLNDFDVEVVPPREELWREGQDKDDQLVSSTIQLNKILGKARECSQTTNINLQRRGSIGNQENNVKALLHQLDEWKKTVTMQRDLKLPTITEPGDVLPMNSDDSMSYDELKTLLAWQNNLSRLRATLMLHVQYRYVGILLTRAYLLQDVNLANKMPPTEDAMPETELSMICLNHACQMARTILLLDSFNLVNGISAMDVFYAHSAVMILVLRLLRRPKMKHKGKSSFESQSEEDNLQEMLRSLVTRLRVMVTRVEKSGTMKRLADVIALFEDSVDDRPSGRTREGDANDAARNSSRLHFQLRPQHTIGVAGAGYETMQSPFAITNQAGYTGGDGLPFTNPWVPADIPPYDNFTDLNMWMNHMTGNPESNQIWDWSGSGQASGPQYRQQ